MESKVLGDDFGMRFFMCDNYTYDPLKRCDNDRHKVLHETLWFALINLIWTCNFCLNKESTYVARIRGYGYQYAIRDTPIRHFSQNADTEIRQYI